MTWTMRCEDCGRKASLGTRFDYCVRCLLSLCAACMAGDSCSASLSDFHRPSSLRVTPAQTMPAESADSNNATVRRRRIQILAAAKLRRLTIADLVCSLYPDASPDGRRLHHQTIQNDLNVLRWSGLVVACGRAENGAKLWRTAQCSSCSH